MRVLLQKVSSASVSVEEEILGAIGAGYLLFIGIEKGDSTTEAAWLAQKIANLRLFMGEGDKLNDRTIVQAGGSALVVSQFTLMGSVQGGNRPDYSLSAAPAEASLLVDFFATALQKAGVELVERGRFGAHMAVTLVNDGPVTLWLERKPA